MVVLERTGIGSGQSGIQPGGVRQQWGTAVACRLARESAAFWGEAERELRLPGRAGLPRLRLSLRRPLRHSASSGCGRTSRSRTRRGSFSHRVAGGGGCPRARASGPSRSPALRGVTRTATSTGRNPSWRRSPAERMFESRECTRFGRTTPGWELDTSAGSAVRRHRGRRGREESVELVADLGVELPIESEERHLFLSEPVAERLLEPLVVSGERSFAAKQLGDGRVLASDLAAAGDADEGASGWRANVRAGIREAAAPAGVRRLPDPRERRLRHHPGPDSRSSARPRPRGPLPRRGLQRSRLHDRPGGRRGSSPTLSRAGTIRSSTRSTPRASKMDGSVHESQIV